MGRSRTPTHIVRYTQVVEGEHQIRFTDSAWPTQAKRGGGRPTQANLTRYIEGTNESFEPGGVNEHLSQRGTVRILGAEIVNQHTGEVKATYSAA